MVANFAGRSARSGWLHAGVVAFVLVVCLSLVGIDGWRALQDRTRTINEDRIETSNLATSLAQHAHDVVQAADAALFAIRGRVELETTLHRIPLEQLHDSMMARVANLSVLHGLFILDVAGNRVVSSLPADTGVRNYSDRAYFQYHRAHPDRGVRVGEPMHDKSDGSWVIPLSRRIDMPDGRFGGVAVATISVAVLQRFYDTFDVGKNGVITLLSRNGIVIARRPYRSATIGIDASKNKAQREILNGSPSGNFRSSSPVDGIDRLGSYRATAGYPFIILVAHDFHDVLADWRLDTCHHLAVSLGAALALAYLGSRFARQIKIGQQAESSYRLLAENSSDAIVCARLDGRKLYVSPSFSKLTGWSVDEALKMEWGSMVHPDDRQSTLDIKAHLLAGKDVTIRFRYVCKDGSDLWVEACLRPVESARGPDVPYVANIRDISQHKAAEDEIMALNRKLAAQASTDELTGLANRRGFEQALARECRRVARESSPLSLLMIDVDRFKVYNDRYGHPQGDRCLRIVATAIADCLQRPGDLAARYGGEEIVVLLPGTQTYGAIDVAERVRRAIETIGLEHEGNSPGEIVTVSIGVATMEPGLDDLAGRSDELVARADAALYRAKHDGRNRFVVAEAALTHGKRGGERIVLPLAG